jgi:DNA-binding NarL/FixJ family response regulator
MNGLQHAMTSPAAGPAHSRSTVTVLLVDDHPLVRDGVALLLTDGGFNVVGQGSNLAEGLRLADAVRADVMVVDVSLGDGSGLDLVTAVRTKRPAMGIVVLTMHDDDETLLAALDAGASSLVLKTSSSEEVLAMVRRAADSPHSFSAVGVAEALRRRSSDIRPTLTAREMEVLDRLAVGDSVAGMAKRLYMSQSTAKTHIAKLYTKLGAHNRASAVMAAVKLGFIKSQP